MQTVFYYEFPLLGNISLLQENGAICGLYFSDAHAAPPKATLMEMPVQKEAARQLLEYVKGKRRDFDLPILFVGTEFQKKVWEALRSIPYGQTRTYGEIAREIDSPRAFRAVGMANNRNPVSVIVPCHRVIGASGDLVGYGGGLERKRALLALEREHA